MKSSYLQVVTLLKSHFPYINFSVDELQTIERRGGEILIYKNDEEVCGYLILDVKIPTDEPLSPHKNCLYLSYMGTKNKYRGQGIGRSLLLRARVIAEEEHKNIYTYVASFNIKELNLLFSEGFKALKKIHRYNQDWIELGYLV